MTQFDAIGKAWDVAVVSGKATPRDRSTMSVQVQTHGSVDSGISGIGNTNPDLGPELGGRAARRRLVVDHPTTTG